MVQSNGDPNRSMFDKLSRPSHVQLVWELSSGKDSWLGGGKQKLFPLDGVRLHVPPNALIVAVLAGARAIGAPLVVDFRLVLIFGEQCLILLVVLLSGGGDHILILRDFEAFLGRRTILQFFAFPHVHDLLVGDVGLRELVLRTCDRFRHLIGSHALAIPLCYRLLLL